MTNQNQDTNTNASAVTLHRVEGTQNWWQAIGETGDEWVAASEDSIVEVEP